MCTTREHAAASLDDLCASAGVPLSARYPLNRDTHTLEQRFAALVALARDAGVDEAYVREHIHAYARGA